MRFPPAFLDEIRARIPISQVVARKVSWDKRKSNPGRGDFWACCPFHGEKTPSFHAEDRKGRYHCFGCGVSGDHFTFLVEQEGLSFPEAVAQLAAEAGIPLPERDPEAEKRETERATLHEVMERAARFFETELQGPEGSKARAYLRERGLSADVQKRFRIGYAPASRNALKEHLAGSGITQEQMIELGLLVSGEDIPVSFDRFRDRVVFPISDLRGRIIAFGGRALSNDVQAKYLNSPETPLFHKSRVLYNGHAARSVIRKAERLVVVEGYIDVISCVAAGFEATVAPLGTALTEDQLRLMWQMADEPVLCFDGDEAGLKAAFRAVELALPHLMPGKSLRFALLPQGFDPDDFIREFGKQAFEELLDSAKPLVDVLWQKELTSHDISTPEMKARLEKAVFERIATIADSTVKRYYRSHFRLKVVELLGRGQPDKGGKFTEFAAHIVMAGQIEQIILGMCVEYPALIEGVVDEFSNLSFSNEASELFFRELHKLYVDYGELPVSRIYELIDPRFYFILQKVHGKEVQSSLLQRRGLPSDRIRRREAGHRLFAMVPILKLGLPLATVQQVLNYFILKLRYLREKAYCDNMVASSGWTMERVTQANDRLFALNASLREAETELDAQIQYLKGRNPDIAIVA